MHDAAYKVWVVVNQGIAEFEGKSGAETKVQPLFQTVPKGATLSGIFRWTNSESFVLIIYKDISNIY